MLAFAPSSSSSPSYNYTPAIPIPSPLSPRSANIHGSLRHQPQPHNFYHMDTKIGTSNASTSSRRNVKTPFSQRPIKRAPLIPTTTSQQQQQQQHTRRNAYSSYLRKVSNQREERRFETRGEDMMRWDFMQRQRAWEAECAAFAASHVLGEEEEEEEEEGGEAYHLPMSRASSGQMMNMQQSCALPEEEAEVEEFLRDEGKELEALLEYMPDDDDDAMKEDDFDGTSLCSDDADYDALFDEVLSQQQQGRAGDVAVQSSQIMPDTQQQQQHESGGDDEMDMS